MRPPHAPPSNRPPRTQAYTRSKNEPARPSALIEMPSRHLGVRTSHVYDSSMVFAHRSRSFAWPQTWRRLLPPGARLALFALLLTSTHTSHAKEKPGKAEKIEKEAAPEAAADPTETGTDDGTSTDPSASTEANSDSDQAEVSLDASSDETSLPVTNGNMKPTIMFFDMGFRSDISLLYTRTTVGRFQEQEDFDVKAFGPMLHVGILTKFFWKLRIGAALGYGFNYRMNERLTEFEEEEQVEPESWVLGQIYTGDIRLEFSQELVDKLWLVATPRGGLQAVVPGEHLLREREAYEGAYNVRQGPQLGVIGGFEIGARYLLLDWLAVRASGSYDYYSQGLLKAKRKSDTVDYTALWRMSGARVGGNLGVEAVF